MIKTFKDQIPEKFKNKIVKDISKIKEKYDEYPSYICRSDLDTTDSNECIFCSINRTPIGSWYAKCKLYDERLKRYHDYDIAQCCESCYKDLDKKIIRSELEV